MGVVTDADTGHPISRRVRRLTYADGNHGTRPPPTLTELYAFDIADGRVTAIASADFEISAYGYHTKTESRLIEYNDDLTPASTTCPASGRSRASRSAAEGAQSIEARPASVYISHALLAPKGGITDYLVHLSAYDPDDPGGTLCAPEADWYTITSADPPPRALSLECSVPGDTLKVMLYVGVRGATRFPSGGDRGARQLDGQLLVGGAQLGDPLAE